jgi:uncharacterized SAM-binding protein YcdF (DUF218 family)
MALDAIVVLGCRSGERGRLFGSALRRVERAARAYTEGVAPLVIASGGKTWSGISEADAFSARLIALGVPGARIVREQSSQTTRGNARYVAKIARQRGLGRLGIVTCDWHMRRALSAFSRHGLVVEPLPAVVPAPARSRALLRYLLERARELADAAAVSLAGLEPGARRNSR